MADASKLKGLRRAGPGAPPVLDEARMDLAAVGAANACAPEGGQYGTDEVGAHRHALARSARLDGRTMQRSSRTVQFATRINSKFDERIRQIAMRNGTLLVEMLEHALDAYEYNTKEAAKYVTHKGMTIETCWHLLRSLRSQSDGCDVFDRLINNMVRWLPSSIYLAR